MDREAKLFKALSDPLRLRLVTCMAAGGELCVCKLVDALAEPQFKVSRHLAILRAAGLVQARRQGTWMYYRLADVQTEFDRSLRDCLLKLSQEPKMKTKSCSIAAKC
ncbi:MAG: metalloregulator ArsR/SmtB family transcription factor [Planctomycetaceae bacterium]|nr:metalloregulator ArsR/SmtB family transcription factor [Planctomycetaceae bacterium]